MSTNDDDGIFQEREAVLERSVVVGVISLFIIMRIGNIAITRTMFIRKNFSSVYQWRSVLSLQIFSVTTGIFTFGFANIHLWCLVTNKCKDSYSPFFYACYALQNFNYNFWLMARDRALQSPFFKTNVCFIYVVFFLAVISLLCNLTLLPRYGGQFQIIGTLIQISIIAIMTINFVRPLLRSKKTQKNTSSSDVLYSVILRTAIGAAIHVTFSCIFVILLLRGDILQPKLGILFYDFSLFFSTTFPLLLHMALSHRDDKPLYFIISNIMNSILLSLFCDCYHSENQVTPPRLNFHNYRAVALNMFESENNEVKRLGGYTLSDSMVDGGSTHKREESTFQDSIFSDSLFNSPSFAPSRSFVYASPSSYGGHESMGNDHQSHPSHSLNQTESLSKPVDWNQTNDRDSTDEAFWW